MSLRDAHDAIAMSCKSREEAENAMKKMNNLKEAAYHSVNKGLSKKLAETTNLLVSWVGRVFVGLVSDVIIIIIDINKFLIFHFLSNTFWGP